MAPGPRCTVLPGNPCSALKPWHLRIRLTVFGNRASVDVMSHTPLEWTLDPMTDGRVIERRDSETHKQGRRPHEDTGRGWRDAATSQGHPEPLGARRGGSVLRWGLQKQPMLTTP